MSKEYLHGRNWKRYKVQIICDNCRLVLGIDDDKGTLSEKYAALNNGEHECETCKKQRERAYDDFVDPLGAYH